MIRELTLTGQCSYHIDHEYLHLDVEEVRNHRNLNNISGTLDLALWALQRPYDGGGFNGYLIASQPLGELKGQHYFRHCRYGLPMHKPAEGYWHPVLMLREWHNGGWVARDYINFPYRIKAEYKLALSLDGVPMVYRP